MSYARENNGKSMPNRKIGTNPVRFDDFIMRSWGAEAKRRLRADSMVREKG